ncbi:TPA: hypothetical protein MAD82_005291 [Klebsiella pneumoniae]|uniref:hypothetical protein n=1 Tax=Klebsiella pneumoniae TaxID=573 RepID=UPI0020CFA109|nr:hypothetical protein [Klebsiella pneumoniae]MCQ0814093.1 hypothetical protein [Klebsiella pneumoniae]HBS2458716.1 hypothetical protein [Klebsiella pneumoniae]HBS2469854.1 hypothetical protein [Klebsiella pneumoniae]HBS2495729.1 hypothetical protein [Klebsiella pneumoniae]HBS2525790.1 hypothetical protein [Klebsiella pneumoniae]
MVNAESVLIEMARQQDHELNGQERLLVRTRVVSALAAKERHRQRMTAPEYHWRKPIPRR